MRQHDLVKAIGNLVPALTDRRLSLAGDLYIAAMEALYPINPAILFLVEGTAQPQFVVNAGDGFVTSVPLIEATGASNPSTFFRTLLTKPYAQQVGTMEWLPSAWGWLLEVLCLAAVCLRHAIADVHLQRHSLPAVAKLPVYSSKSACAVYGPELPSSASLAFTAIA